MSLWSLTHAAPILIRNYKSVNAEFLGAKTSRCLYLFLLIRSECAPCCGSKGQKWFDCFCQFNHFLMKEAENPLKNMIRLKEQSDPSELGQNQISLCLQCSSDTAFSRLKHVQFKCSFFNKFHTKIYCYYHYHHYNTLLFKGLKYP